MAKVLSWTLESFVKDAVYSAGFHILLLDLPTSLATSLDNPMIFGGSGLVNILVLVIGCGGAVMCILSCVRVKYVLLKLTSR